MFISCDTYDYDYEGIWKVGHITFNSDLILYCNPIDSKIGCIHFSKDISFIVDIDVIEKLGVCNE